MVLRLATRDDVPPLMDLVRRSVPAMRAAGNLQWDDKYPNDTVFLRDVKRSQLWVAQTSAQAEAQTEAQTVAQTSAQAEAQTEAQTVAQTVAQTEAQTDGALAGVAAITTEQAPEYARVGWDIREPAIVVHRLLVDPERRGQGIASALMLQAETVARERGIAVLRVDTSAENSVTQRLFPKLGYTYCGETGFSFRPGLRILCFEKRLSSPSPTAQ